MPPARRTRPALVAALALMVFCFSSIARAQESSSSKKGLTWDWPKFRTSEYVVTGVVGAAALGVFAFGKPRSSPLWTGGILFDDAVRDAVRLRSPRARDRVRAISDITGIASLVLVLGVDSLTVPLVRGSPEVAFQLLLLDAEAFAFNSLFTASTFYSTGRARPSWDDCRKDPTFDPLCSPHDTASFWSGHTSQAFAAAGLSCAHHAYAKLYGGGAPDAVACAGAIALSATTGTLRLLGDRHHATDVATGALVGFGFGYGMPTLLHYAHPKNERRLGLAFTPMDGGAAFSAAGSF